MKPLIWLLKSGILGVCCECRIIEALSCRKSIKPKKTQSKLTKKLKIMESVRPNPVNHFHRLPEELLLYIFSKGPDDLESLCQFSLVSKQFASIISHTKTISATLHITDSDTDVNPHSDNTTDEQVPALLELKSFQKLNLLEKFPELESLSLEYIYPKETNCPEFLNWKLKSSSRNTLLEDFIVLFSTTVNKKIQRNPQGSTELHWPTLSDCFHLSYVRYMEWLCLVSKLAENNASLKSVKVVDSEKQGCVVVREEQLVKMRSCMLEKELQSDNSVIKYVWVPKLRLPSLGGGYVMRGVYLMIVKTLEETSGKAIKNNDDDEDIAYWNFGDEEKVFREAVKAVFKNHKNDIMKSD